MDPKIQFNILPDSHEGITQLYGPQNPILPIHYLQQLSRIIYPEVYTAFLHTLGESDQSPTITALGTIIANMQIYDKNLKQLRRK